MKYYKHASDAWRELEKMRLNMEKKRCSLQDTFCERECEIFKQGYVEYRSSQQAYIIVEPSCKHQRGTSTINNVRHNNTRVHTCDSITIENVYENTYGDDS